LADLLTAPHAVAAIVLCIAGVAKLHSPAGAVRALRSAGLVVGAAVVRAFAAAELALGAWCLLTPSPPGSGLLACTYGGFAGLSVALARSSASCGCFGGGDTPASLGQSSLSAALAALALASALSTPHGAGWIITRPPVLAATLAAGIAGAAYATVLAYTALPRAWRAWSVS